MNILLELPHILSKLKGNKKGLFCTLFLPTPPPLTPVLSEPHLTSLPVAVLLLCLSSVLHDTSLALLFVPFPSPGSVKGYLRDRVSWGQILHTSLVQTTSINSAVIQNSERLGQSFSFFFVSLNPKGKSCRSVASYSDNTTVSLILFTILCLAPARLSSCDQIQKAGRQLSRSAL